MAKAKTTPEPAVSRWVPVLVAVVGALASVAAAWITASATAKREIASTRVESGSVESNSNGPELSTPWEPWESRITERTTMVGVQRRVRFGKSFRNAPRVITALTLINARSLEEVLRDLGHSPSESEARRLRQLHITASAGAPSQDGFVLYVGVGMPSEGADVLIRTLQRAPVNQADLEIHRRFSKLDPKSDTLTASERWMMNFYSLVGTVEVIWIATANEQ
jgi:hypothetical protein